MTGRTLKRFRRRAGLTQARLAAKLGVSRNTVARWESGRGDDGRSWRIPAPMARLIEFTLKGGSR